MAISTETLNLYNELKTEVNALGREVLDRAKKVKSTSERKFAKERDDFRERGYALKRKIVKVREELKEDMLRIAKKQPDVRSYVSMLQQKQAAINKLEKDELKLIQQATRSPEEEAKLSRIVDDLMRLRHTLVQEEVAKDEAIEKYKRGERPNDDIKTLSEWSKSLDRISDALTKLVSNLGM